jgi:hypothetical protein
VKEKKRQAANEKIEPDWFQDRAREEQLFPIGSKGAKASASTPTS